MNLPKTKGLPVLLLGAGLIGFSAIFVKWTVPASPVVVGFYRMTFALPWVTWLVLSTKGGRLRFHGMGWAVLAGLCFTGDLILWHTALRWTSAASATLLVCLAPLWVAVFSVLFLRARLRRKAWLGLALALGGMLLLCLAKGAHLTGNFGEALGGLASFCYAGYTLALSRARRTLKTVDALFAVVVTGLVCFGVLGCLRGDSFGSGFPAHVWLSLIGIGLLVQVAGWWLITWGFGHVPANIGAVGLLMQPIATVVLGWFLLHEALLPSLGLGTVLIILGIGLCSTSPPVLEPRR